MKSLSKEFSSDYKIPANVHQFDWLPQQDLLGHPKVVGFISHCGWNSLVESLYHRVPIAGLPGLADQPLNAVRISNNNLGVKLTISDSTEQLASKIKDMYTNPDYKENVWKVSAELRRMPTQDVLTEIILQAAGGKDLSKTGVRFGSSFPYNLLLPDTLTVYGVPLCFYTYLLLLLVCLIVLFIFSFTYCIFYRCWGAIKSKPKTKTA